MFSKTTESIFDNIKGFDDVGLYMAHGRPIPECFNEPLERALDDGCNWIWFVEEDMLIPPDTLKKFLFLDQPVVTTDYADRRTELPLIMRDNVEEVVFSGMGCMLVKREVFEKMEKPYLRQMVFWRREEPNGDVFWDPQPQIKCESYGQQDIYLCWAIKKAGYRIHEVKTKIGHMSLLSKAEDIINNGGDVIKTVYLDYATEG